MHTIDSVGTTTTVRITLLKAQHKMKNQNYLYHLGSLRPRRNDNDLIAIELKEKAVDD